MIIYDISQEVFSCNVYPGDPSPERHRLLQIADGDECNLTEFTMCAHNGTHVDAPYHFVEGGNTIDQVDLKRFIGYAYVTFFDGEITAEGAESILNKAREADSMCKDPADKASNRILVGGKAVVTEEAAKVFADEQIFLFGNESQTVGPEDASRAVHRIMLPAQIVLLEGIRLSGVPEGVYVLNAAPINLGGSDGAPCRAILMADKEMPR